jgi:hypothetical protein
MPTLEHSREARTTFGRRHNNSWPAWIKVWKERLSLGRFAVMSLVSTPSSQRPLPSMSTQVHQNTPKPRGRQEPFCVFCENRDHWVQDCKVVSDVKDRTDKLKLASRCFLYLNRGHSLKNCSKKWKFIVQCAENRIITPSVMQTKQYPLPWNI